MQKLSYAYVVAKGYQLRIRDLQFRPINGSKKALTTTAMPFQTILMYMDALLVFYRNDYNQELTERGFHSSGETSLESVERVTKARKALQACPELADAIFADFENEIRLYSQEIVYIIAVNRLKK